MAHPPSSIADGRPKNDEPDGVVGDVRRQMQPDEGDVEAADEKTDCEQPESLGVESFP